MSIENELDVDIETTASEDIETSSEISTDSNVNDAEVNIESKDSKQDVGNGKRQFSDKEKQEYAFNKRLSREKKKYREILSEQDKRFQELQAKLDRLENPDKYKPKSRNDFENDESYIDHLVSERVQNILNAQMEQYQKQQQEYNEYNQIEAEYRSKVDANVAELFPDEVSRNDYQDKVQHALDKGLGDLLDSDLNLSKFIINSKFGPKIMYKLATDVNAVKSLFEDDDVFNRQLVIREIEKEFKQNNVKPVSTARPQIKPIGRPGMKQNTPTNSLDDDKAILNMLRRR